MDERETVLAQHQAIAEKYATPIVHLTPEFWKTIEELYTKRSPSGEATMKLWRLDGDYHVLLVRAETEQDARNIAVKEDTLHSKGYLDPKSYICVEVLVDGDPEVIMDYSG